MSTLSPPRDALGSAAEAALLGSALPVVRLGPDGRVRGLNPAAARALPGTALDDAWQPDDADAPPGQALPLEDGGTLVLLTPLDGFQEAEQARFEKTPYGVLRLDVHGRVRFANERARAMWPGLATGVEFAALLPDPVLARTMVEEVVRTETSRVLRPQEAARGALPSAPQITLVPYYLPGRHIAGVVAHVRARVLEALRIAVREAASGEGAGGANEDWQGRMCAVLDLVQHAAPHDRAVLSVMSQDRRWVRPILVHPPADPPMPPGWAPVPPQELARMRQGAFTIDMAELLERSPELRQNSLVRTHDEAGLVSNAVLPFPEKDPEALLTLCSAKRRHFRDLEETHDPSDDVWPPDPFRGAMALGLDPILVGMLRRVERQQDQAMRALAHRVGTARTLPEASNTLLVALVEQFRWDHAALFAVEPGEGGGRFRLFAQYPEQEQDGHPHPLALPPGYTQPLYAPAAGATLDLERARASGMMGSAVRAGRPLVVASTLQRDAAGDCEYFFRSPTVHHGSAMTVPIEFDGRIRWVLDTVSRYPNAFHEDDGELAGPMVRRLARQLASRRNAWLNEMLIERIEQGVVVTDSSLVLLRANARARDMLGLPQGAMLPEGRLLSAHASDDAARTFLAGPDASGTVRLGPIGGVGSDVRVVRSEDTMQTRDLVWLLDGADAQDWMYDRTYIEATVQEVARQVRGPLLMASTLAGRLARQMSTEAAPALEQLRAQIGKADLTFERLAEAIGAKRDPRRTDDRVDLAGLVQDVLEALPERDRARAPAGTVPAGRIVRGDRERLRFVLRTLLGHLLTACPDRIRIGADLRGNHVTLSLEPSEPAPAERAGPLSLLEEAAQAAREAAGLAYETVEGVLHAHGGAVRRTGSGFEFDLPLEEAT